MAPIVFTVYCPLNVASTPETLIVSAAKYACSVDVVKVATFDTKSLLVTVVSPA